MKQVINILKNIGLVIIYIPNVPFALLFVVFIAYNLIREYGIDEFIEIDNDVLADIADKLYPFSLKAVIGILFYITVIFKIYL